MKRIDELYDVKLHDPYMDRTHYKDPTICPQCGLIFHNKRWVRNETLRKELEAAGTEFAKKLCPACKKIEDRYPLGVLELRGGYIKQPDKRELILNTLKHEAENEEARNPLARIMQIREEDGNLVIWTTTESLARRLGRVVYKAFKGDLKISFSENNKFIRVLWERE